MDTRHTIEEYFRRLEARDGWEGALADDMVFRSFTSPNREIKGKQAYLQGTNRFYSSIQSFRLRQLVVEGDRGIALTRYQLRSPAGSTFTTDVAEAFTVADGQIASFEIYFDSAPFPK